MRKARRHQKKFILAVIFAALAPVFFGRRAETLVTESKGRTEARSTNPTDESLTGKVVRVMDGDTVELLVTDAERKQRVRIRLAGIDAPERSQAFGEVCRESLAGVVAGKDVQIRVRGKDRYSRTLGVIFVRKDAKGSTEDVNLGQISAGCAWHYKQYLMNQLPREREQYAAAEETARKARQGLWRDAHPQPPWEFRLSKKGRSSR